MHLAKETKNPCNMNYVKTALNVSRTDEFPLLKSLNKVLTDTVGVAYDAIGTAFAKTKSVADLDSMNDSLPKSMVYSQRLTMIIL